MKRIFVLDPANPRRDQVAANLYACLREWPGAAEVTVKEPTRTSDQNSRLWAALHDIARQVQWPVNGELVSLSPEDWKDLLTAALRNETRMACGINGGFVLLGTRTSTMSKRQLSELLECVYSFGADKGVVWSERVAA